MRDHLQFDHRFGSRKPDRAQALATHLRQPRERVLSERALLGNVPVATLLRQADWPVGLSLSNGVRFTYLTQ